MKFATLAAIIAVVAAETEKPGSAKTDLAKDAATKAAEDISAFDASRDKEYKTTAKYDTLDAAGKKKVDDELKAKQTARTKRDADEKKAAGYDTMTAEQKTVYDAGLLAFKKQVYTDCKADAKAIKCTKSTEIRAAQEKKRNTDKYYGKKTADREAADKLQKTESEKLEKSLAAAAKKAAEDAAKPKAGAAGFSCKAAAGARPKCNTGLCCGAGKKAGAAAGTELETCQKSTDTKYTHKLADGKTEEWAFACIKGAHNLAASAAALVAASYMLA